MKVHVLRPNELTADVIRAWSEIQRGDAAFDSPYFRPEFTIAVANVRRGVEIALLEDGSQIVGVFPFERAARRIGKPLAGRLSDYQAVIKRPQVRVEPRELIKSCRLSAWDFDHLLTSQTEFSDYHHLTDGSPYLDLSGGYANYCRARRDLGDEELQKSQRKARQLCREVGPIRVVGHVDDPQLLELMLKWKSQQYRRTHITDVFAFPWTSDLLRHLLEHRTSEFAGMLSALYVNDRPIAIHMGMMSCGVLHYWFPTYDQEFAKYSPGRVLLVELVRFCQELGIRKIDMGRGMAPFKTRMMTGVTTVAAGSVDLRPITSALRDRWRQTSTWIRNSSLRRSIRIPGRVLYRVREWLEFR